VASLNSWGFYTLDAERDGARLLAVAERAARSVSAEFAVTEPCSGVDCRLTDSSESAVFAKGSREPTVLSK